MVQGLDVGNFRLRASRDRGTIEISLAPLYATRGFHSLGLVLVALEQGDAIPEVVPSPILHGAGGRMAAEFANINAAFSPRAVPNNAR